MPGSSPDRAPPPAIQDQEDAAAAADDEATPFLPSSNNNSRGAGSSLTRPVTASALSFSILALVAEFATVVAQRAGPVSFNLPWRTKEGLNGVVVPAIFSILFSTYNLRRLRCHKAAAPLVLNLVADVLIAFFAILYGAGGLSGLLDGHGGWCSYPGGNFSYCSRGALPLKVFAGIAMAAGVVLGAMHFVLFCVRCRVAYNSGFGRSPWALPVGQLKFEVSIKFVREPEREAGEVTV